MAKKKNNAGKRALIVILVLVAAAVIVGGTLYGVAQSKANEQQKPSSSLPISTNGVALEKELDKSNGTLQVDMNCQQYQVTIVPNESATFDFYVNGNLKSFPTDAKWQQAFNLQAEEGKFTFNNQLRNLNQILSVAFDGATVETVGDIDANKAYFTLVIEYDGIEVKHDLVGFYSSNVYEITLDKTEIIF